MHKQTQPSCLHFYHRGQHGKSLDHYKHAKIYSHIADEYNFRIGNKLMVQKIINPRRDKTIMDSLIHASPKYILRKKKIVQREGRDGDDRRKQAQIVITKKADLHSQDYEIQEFRGKQVKKIKQGLLKSMDQAFSMHNQIHPSKQIQREAALTKSIETRDCSLRNNFVGKIIKNQKIQPHTYFQKKSTSRIGAKLLAEVVQSEILRDSDENNSIYPSYQQKCAYHKRRLIKQTTHNISRGHFRELSTEKSKQNNQSYLPLEENSRVINSVF